MVKGATGRGSSARFDKLVWFVTPGIRKVNHLVRLDEQYHPYFWTFEYEAETVCGGVSLLMKGGGRFEDQPKGGDYCPDCLLVLVEDGD